MRRAVGAGQLRAALTALLLPVLAACGGAEPGSGSAAAREITTTEKLINRCVNEGASGEMCACDILAMANALSADELAQFAELAERDAASARAYRDEIFSDRPESAAKMAQSIQGCLGG